MLNQGKVDNLFGSNKKSMKGSKKGQWRV